jgi:hypothetical protein
MPRIKSHWFTHFSSHSAHLKAIGFSRALVYAIAAALNQPGMGLLLALGDAQGCGQGPLALTYTTAIFSILCRNKQQEKLVSTVTQKHQGRPRPKSSCECQGGPGWSRLNLRFASFSLEHWGCTPNLRSANRIQPRVPSLTLHKCAENWWLFLLCLTLVLTKLHLAEMLQIFYFVDPVLLQFVAEIWIFLLVGHWN